MARAAVECGISTIVATPHAFGTSRNAAPDARDAALGQLRSALADEGLSLTVLPGFECLLTADLCDILNIEPRYLLPSLAEFGLRGKASVLVEVTDEMPPVSLPALSFAMQNAGVIPILAHPERHAGLRRHRGLLADFVSQGGRLQITAAGLTGACGWLTRRFCVSLVRDGLVASVASDAHGAWDFADMPKAYEQAKRLIGPRAGRLFGKS